MVGIRVDGLCVQLLGESLHESAHYWVIKVLQVPTVGLEDLGDDDATGVGGRVLLAFVGESDVCELVDGDLAHVCLHGVWVEVKDTCLSDYLDACVFGLVSGIHLGTVFEGVSLGSLNVSDHWHQVRKTQSIVLRGLVQLKQGIYFLDELLAHDSWGYNGWDGVVGASKSLGVVLVIFIDAASSIDDGFRQVFTWCKLFLFN